MEEKKKNIVPLSPTFPTSIIGVHVSKKCKFLDKTESLSILEAIDIDTKILNINATQIFTHGPRGYAPTQINKVAIKKYIEDNNITLIVHSSYPTVAAWKPENNGFHVKQQLETCLELGAAGLVIHLPNLPPTEIAKKLFRFARWTRKDDRSTSKAKSTKILLEINATKPSHNSHETAAKLNELCEAIDKQGVYKSSWGICVDTAHLWSCGIDLSTAEATQQWFKDFKYNDRIKLVHLNGCVTDFASGKDEHAIIATEYDQIYGRFGKQFKSSGAYVVFKFCREHHIPVILEINLGLQHEVISILETLKNIH